MTAMQLLNRVKDIRHGITVKARITTRAMIRRGSSGFMSAAGRG